MNRLFSCALILLAFAAPGCQSTPSVAGDDANYVLVFLRTGPRAGEKTAEENQKIFAGHMANIQRLGDDHALLIAGPYGKGAHDPALRGIFVFDVATVEQAKTLTATDPGVQAGVFVVQAAPMHASTALRSVYALDQADKQAAAAAGKPTGMGDMVRPYVMVTAHDAARADAALKDLVAQGKVVWSGQMGGALAGQGIYVLDAEDVAAAKRMLGAAADQMGPCDLDAWWSTKALVKLNAKAAGEPRS